MKIAGLSCPSPFNVYPFSFIQNVVPHHLSEMQLFMVTKEPSEVSLRTPVHRLENPPLLFVKKMVSGVRHLFALVCTKKNSNSLPGQKNLFGYSICLKRRCYSVDNDRVNNAFLVEIMLILKAIKLHFRGAFD